MVGCTDDKSDTDDTVTVESVAISKTAVVILVDEELTLTATVAPENATDKSVVWTSDSEKVTIENGKIKGIAKTQAGEEVTITASAGGKSTTCQVTVITTQAQDIASAIVPEGKTLSSEADALKNIDETIATIKKTEDDKVNITPKKAQGVTTVSVKYADGAEEVFAITITDGTVSIRVVELVATPVITCNEENFVTITCATAGSDIFYTINGMEPSLGSDKYTEPFLISDTTTIKAFATNLRFNNSNFGETTFKLWTVTFDTDGGSAIEAQKVLDGEKAKVIEPIKDGFAFGYWSEGEDEFDIDTPITRDIALKVNWLITSKGVANFTSINFTPRSNTKYEFAADVTEDNFNAIGYKAKITTSATNLSLDFSRCNKITSIGRASYYSLQGCKGLVSIIIPDSVTEIGSSTFEGCANLESVNIPDGVTSIGDNAFSGCYSLASITIPNSVTSIGAGVFQSCRSLTSITIPDSVTSIGDSAFSSTNLTNVTIPDSVTSIGRFVFNGCTKLTNITIPNSVTSIGGGAFESCKSLASITIPDSVTGIGDSTFENCTSLASFTISDGVKRIGKNAFCGCTSLANIIIPDSVTSIDWRAFQGCTSLTSVTIPDSITSIEMDIFQNCTSLTSVTIPGTVTRIWDSAFQGCTSLASITIPNSVTSISNRAFQGCTGLTSITIPNSVIWIDEHVFQDCTSLTSITILGRAVSIKQYAFSGCTDLANITILGSIASIEQNAFEGCSSLTNITIPNGVKSIGNNAFERCSSLENITIPSSVTSIGVNIFDRCTNLKTITVWWEEGSKPEGWSTNWNKGCNAQIIYNGGA